MKTKTYIIIVKVREDSYDRTDLEHIEGQTFSSVEEARKQLQIYNPNVKVDCAVFVPLYQFTTDWNDTDDSAMYLDINDSFISYVNIGE